MVVTKKERSFYLRLHFIRAPNSVIPDRVPGIAQLMNHHPTIEMGKALVNIVRGNMQLIDHE